MENKQIKSRDRVKDLAEVYTNEREVNAMLDLLPNNISYDISARYLEPACGNGNFLVKILKRKIQTVSEQYTDLKKFEFYSLKALSSMYGIDICPENVEETKNRLLSQLLGYFSLHRNSDLRKPSYINSIKYILNKNIVCGNTLQDQEKIILSEFTTPQTYYFKERKFTFKELYNKKPVSFEELEPVHYLKLGETTLFTNQN